MQQKIVFFIGKGGVGKSTVSALTAINNAKLKKSTLLVSLDPAHNQQDIFWHKFSEKAYEIFPNLHVIEINIDKRIKQYLNKTSQKIQNNYNYQTAFSLKNYFKVLKHSPGLEEYALLQAFEDIVSNYKKTELIIFDMPPTALSLRFFSLPKTGLIWLNQLSELRKAILKKKEIISSVKFGKKEIETDKVKNHLHELTEQHRLHEQVFQSENTKINIVLNNDELSVKESIRLNDKLKELKLKTAHYIKNKISQPVNQTTEKQLLQKPTIHIPEYKGQLTGIDNLQDFIQQAKLSESLLRL